MAPSLIGPPLPSSTTTTTQPPSTTAKTTDPFLNLMVSNFNTLSTTTTPAPLPPTGFTENRSATYLSSGNPCLDLFFQVVPNTPSNSLTNLLDRAWSHNPLTTLKLICNLRGVRGTGKSDKNGFYTAVFWLHKNHPKTLACNLDTFAEFGYFKDLPEILFRVIGMTHAPKMKKQIKGNDDDYHPRRPFNRFGVKKSKKGFKKNSKKGVKSVGNVGGRSHRQEREKEFASEVRRKKKADMAKLALERYNRDPDYRFLHDRVSDLFVEFLRSDLESLNAGNLNKISLAAKWCPSLDSSYDRATLLCEAIARKVYQKEEEYEGLEEAHYAYRVRDRLRKEVLVPLRRALELPEVYMGARRWNELPYNRVASVARKTYKELFAKHDEGRFKEYKSGKAKIAAGALLPHETVASLLQDNDDGKVAELQWKRMEEDMSKEGKLSNCISVCDVSKSMNGTPMEVGVSLGLLLSQLTVEPWKGKVITFCENPQLHLVGGNDLMSKTRFIREMDWGSNNNFQKVFDLILNVAVHGKLPKENMIKRVFVFSDMEFGQASKNSWETDYQVIRNKFEKSGYGDAVPEIVFWNLRDSRSTPVVKDQKGVALVSGFSKNMMKLFLDGKQDELTPESVMEAAISGDEYSKLAVLD